MMKTNSAVIYEGPSRIDGSPIVVIVSGLLKGSKNGKTGEMLQTWILCADVAPNVAVHSGADVSICGSCPHRGSVVDGRNIDRSCYVLEWQAPLSTWKSWKRGNIPSVKPRGLGAGRMVRLGSYGDPGAVPIKVWRDFVYGCTGHTGYTHQWTNFRALRELCMASVDSVAEQVEAVARGFRTFRVKTRDSDPLASESVCPASHEAGRKLSCEQCRACGGADGRKGSIVIDVHGARGKRVIPIAVTI